MKKQFLESFFFEKLRQKLLQPRKPQQGWIHCSRFFLHAKLKPTEDPDAKHEATNNILVDFEIGQCSQSHLYILLTQNRIGRKPT